MGIFRPYHNTDQTSLRGPSSNHTTIPTKSLSSDHTTIQTRGLSSDYTTTKLHLRVYQETNCSMVGVYFAMSLILGSAMVTLGEEVPTCSSGATTLSTSPRHDMVLCKGETEQTCEKDFESLCPAGWNLCTPGQFNNRNNGWNYNWVQAGAGTPLGVVFCFGGRGYALHFGINSNSVLNTNQPKCWVHKPTKCFWHSSRPGCEYWADYGADCDDKKDSALCCAPSTTCGDGLVQEEEDCDDGNEDNMDECLNTCTWKYPDNHI